MEKNLKRVIIFSVLCIEASIIATAGRDGLKSAMIPGFIGVIGLIVELFRK